MGVPLETDAAQLAHIRRFFEGRGRPMAERNAVQAMCPVGASMVTNHWGTAPGLAATLGRAAVYVMPGVPREMRAMLEHAIEPELIERGLLRDAARAILTTKVNTFGLGESDVAERLGDLMQRDRMPVVGTTVAQGIVSVRVRSEAASADDARAALTDTAAVVKQRLGATVFGDDDATLQAALVELLVERQLTATTAESCTGGLIGAALTDVPGCSAAFAGGFVTYSNALKTAQLGVSAETLEAHGAVSAPVALAMAAGARRGSGADLAVSVTGVAGPDGGTDAKPVGTVWIGLASADTHAALRPSARCSSCVCTCWANRWRRWRGSPSVWTPPPHRPMSRRWGACRDAAAPRGAAGLCRSAQPPAARHR
jgi:nicotinamide-nucleotide amidase